MAFVMFVLLFIFTNQLGLPYGLAFVFKLVAPVFLAAYIKNFYKKILEYIELKTPDNNSNPPSNNSPAKTPTSFLKKIPFLK
jgi:hypothetical protein